MLKIVKKYISFVLVLAITISCMVIPTKAVVPCGSAEDGYRCHYNAWHTLGHKVMNYGVGESGSRRRYYWTNGFDEYWENLIANAVSEWVNTTSGVGVTTSISIRETTTKSDAVFEIVTSGYEGTYVPDNAGGGTAHYLYNERVGITGNGSNNTTALTGNYGWARCYINVDNLNNYSNSVKILYNSIIKNCASANNIAQASAKGIVNLLEELSAKVYSDLSERI